MWAEPMEKFSAGVILDRVLKKYPGDSSIGVRCGKNVSWDPSSLDWSDKNWHEEHALKTDFFLVRGGQDWIAFDTKSPKGVDSGWIDWDNHWICPFDSYGNKRDVSLEVKIENPPVKDRFLAFIESDRLVLVSSTKLAEWLMAHVWPDFHSWNDDREKFLTMLDLEEGCTEGMQSFMPDKNRKKILTSIHRSDLRALGSSVKFSESERDYLRTLLLKNGLDEKQLGPLSPEK